MIKIPGVDLEKIKKMGSDLVDSVTSGEVLNKVKSGVDSITQGSKSNIVLPDDIKNSLDKIELLLTNWRQAQVAEQKASAEAFHAVNEFSRQIKIYCEKHMGTPVEKDINGHSDNNKNPPV